jgi:hypothetical protein
VIAWGKRDYPAMKFKETKPDQHFRLRIADLTVEVASHDSAFNLGLEGGKAMFTVHEGTPDVRIRASWAELPEDEMKQILFDAGTVWQIYRDNGSFVFRFRSLAFGPRPYRIARFNPDFSNGEVHLHRDFFKPGAPVDPLSAPLDELLYGTLLARGRGAEIHACGLIDTQGHGHLFVGKSGAGKTTMARLWQDEPGVTILSDDRIILRKVDGRIWMYGTPWHGDGGMASPEKVLLKRVYFLEKGERNELLPRRRVQAALGLSACSFPPFYSREAMEFTLGFVEAVAREIPCYELQFVPDKRLVEFISKLNCG